MKKLTATDRHLVTVLLGGEVTNSASISSLAEKGLVRCGVTLTPAGREEAFLVLSERIPDIGGDVRAALAKAAAYAAKGLVCP